MICAAFAALLGAACTTDHPVDAGPAPNAAAARGYAFARANCAVCHATEPESRASIIAQATPFQILAERPGVTRIALAAWLNTSHPTMPNLVVEEGEADDLWAYLTSLKPEN